MNFQIILFKNVRFGAEPERFGAPSFPSWTDSSVHKQSESLSCIQVDRTQLNKPPGGSNPIGDEDPAATETEDCLFLDLYVSKSVYAGGEASPTPSLPVVVWIYGGAYAFGSKDQEGPLYTGQALLRASRYGAIFVVGNYRIGAFGFLAGSYMEKVGQPNAGLYDQALLLEWVQKYISLVGGDPRHVSAWGESAGAGSILHHLIRNEGTHDPKFQTFFAQSPAFEWSWDNSPGGRLDTTFKSFSELAGCGSGYNISCLREADTEKLKQANQNLYNNIRQTGLFPVGPAVDGKWIKSIPAVTLSQSKSDGPPSLDGC
jgi:carboxylesterase type B